MNKAVFLDRDGVINTERNDYVWKVNEFVLNNTVQESLAELKRRGFLLIVVTNQGGIDKGLYTKNEVEQCHKKMKDELAKSGVTLDEIYYCSHHPDFSNCICRKPDSLFIEKAIARFDIDTAASFFIGDRERDIQAAEKAGVRGILINCNAPLKEIILNLK